MNNDLISREALLKNLKEMKVEGEVFTTAVNFAIEVIDNAPAVENITVFSEGADEETLEDIKKELKKVLDKLKEKNNG